MEVSEAFEGTRGAASPKTAKSESIRIVAVAVPMSENLGLASSGYQMGQQLPVSSMLNRLRKVAVSFPFYFIDVVVERCIGDAAVIVVPFVAGIVGAVIDLLVVTSVVAVIGDVSVSVVAIEATVKAVVEGFVVLMTTICLVWQPTGRKHWVTRLSR